MKAEVMYMVTQVAKWGNSQGIRMNKQMLNHVGLSIGDSVELLINGKDIVIKPKQNIDWYLQNYERPTQDEGWETEEAAGREIW